MNAARAQQIVDAPEEITVLYQDVPVWIQHVNESEGTARVYTRDNPEDEQVVPIAQLREVH